MKKILSHTLLLSLLVLLVACSNEAEETNNLFPVGMGGLNLNNTVSTENKIPIITKSADFSMLDVKDFYVGIFSEDGAQVKEYTKYSDLIDDGLPFVLPHGSYTAISSTFERGDKLVSETPYFVDEYSFIIEEKRITNVRLACTFESIGVELVVSEQFQQKIEAEENNYTYEVTVSNGVTVWEFTPDDMNPGYFLDACDELVVSVKVRLGSSDKWYPTRTYHIKNNGNAPQLGEYYIITLDAGDAPEVNEEETPEAGGEEAQTYSLKTKVLNANE